jgi:hypothetical protein
MKVIFKLFPYELLFRFQVKYLLRSINIELQPINRTELVFVNVSGAQESIEESILPAYVAWRAGTTNRVVVMSRQAGN